MEYSIGESKGEAWLGDAPKHRGLSPKTQHSNTLPAGPLPRARFSRGSTATSDRRAPERGIPRGGIEEPKRSSAAQSRAPQQRRTAVTSRLFPTYGVAYGSPVIITFFFSFFLLPSKDTKRSRKEKEKKSHHRSRGEDEALNIQRRRDNLLYKPPARQSPFA